MFESGYYPPGAEFDPAAPYNQKEDEEQEFEIQIRQSFDLQPTISSRNYNYDCDGSYLVGDGIEEFKEQYDIKAALNYCINMLRQRAAVMQDTGTRMRRGQSRWQSRYLKQKYNHIMHIVDTLKLYAEADINIED